MKTKFSIVSFYHTIIDTSRKILYNYRQYFTIEGEILLYTKSCILQKHDNLNFQYHTHLKYEIVSVTCGSLYVYVNGKKITVNSGQALYIPPYFVHGFETKTNSKTFIYEFDSVFVHEKLPSDIILFSLREDIIPLYYDADNSDNIFFHKALIYRILSAMTTEQEKKYTLATDSLCLGATKFIAEKFSEPITLKDAARHLNVNYAYLSRVFKKNGGLSFTECLNSTRINHATALLSQADMSVTDIALCCGFGSVRNFNRLFLSRMNCTPLQFKKYHTLQ